MVDRWLPLLFSIVFCSITLPWTDAFAGPEGHRKPDNSFASHQAVGSQPSAVDGRSVRLRGCKGARKSRVQFDDYARAGLAACICGITAGLAFRRVLPVSRTRRGDLRVIRLSQPDVRNSSGSSSIVPSTTPSNANIEHVETSLAEFVPKICALQDQAELLRSQELQEVISTMKELRNSDLRGVFSEVDQLLCALIDAITGLRESALTIDNNELRQYFEVDQGNVEALKGLPAESQANIDTMMDVHVVGLSHHNAPVEVREKLAVAQPGWNAYAKELVEFGRTSNGYLIPEVAVLSTCNRFEIYFASPEMKSESSVECMHAFIRKKSGLTRDELEPYLFTHSGEAATQHLFEVSSGLDSLVLGEAQILAQVKACHEHCIAKTIAGKDDSVAGSGGKIIAKMMNAGIRTGKLVRTRTNIGKGSVSVSSAAVELMMSRCMPDLRKYASNLNVCILGAGKMARLLLIALYSKHPDINLTLVTRSVDKAQALLDEVSNRGGTNASVVANDSMWDAVLKSDVVFAATSSKEPIINAADLQSLSKNLMLVDICVPRNVAADCGDVDRVTSYDVDDLKKVVAANAEKRQSEVIKAKQFIGEEANKFKLWKGSQGAVPYITALQTMADKIRKEETARASKKLKGLHDKEREAVDKLTKHIIDQLFRPIFYSMRDDEEMEAKKNKIWALKNMFKLEPEYKRRLLPQGTAPAQITA